MSDSNSNSFLWFLAGLGVGELPVGVGFAAAALKFSRSMWASFAISPACIAM